MNRRVDTLIRNALLIDGSGSEPSVGDLAISGPYISAVGDVGGACSSHTIDANGLALAPGFIDVHTHDDFAAMLYPDMGFKLSGGVTTCVVGNCGFGAAPYVAAMQLAKSLHPRLDVVEYDGFRGYFEQFARAPTGVNIAALAGHGTLRAAVMGAAVGEPSDRELKAMKDLLDEALDAGVVGLSSGLIYEPGRHAKTDELVELARQLSGTGALYATHMRDEGAGLLGSVAEAIDIGRRANVPVQISHHKAAGADNWGMVSQSLALIEAAQARGESVHADQYPYTAGSTILRGVIDNGAFLDAPAKSGIGRVAASDAVIASAPGHPQWEGQTVASIARELGLAPREAALHVDREAPGATVILHMMSEDDVRKVLCHPSTMIGSDGIPTLDGKPHPRLGNTFARVIGHYARDVGLMTISEAVHRMTEFPATKFGLTGRGALREGAYADLVLFDAQGIIDRGTYDDPLTPPDGIERVFVNGIESLSGGRLLGVTAGHALRREQ